MTLGYETLTTFQIGQQDEKVYVQREVNKLRIILDFLKIKELTSVKLYNILVSRKISQFNGKKINYNSISNYSNIVNIELLYPNGQKINLPKNIEDRLRFFIKNEKSILKGENDDFDCFSFVNYLNNIQIDDRRFSNYKYVHLNNLEQLSIGDIILTGHEKRHALGHHYSINLGKGYFLGVLGPGEHPFIYDLNSLIQLYPFNLDNIIKCSVIKK